MSSHLRHILFFAVIICCLLPRCSASLYLDEQLLEARPAAVEEDLGAAFERLAKSGIILVDQSPPPRRQSDWTLATLADDLRRRQVGDNPETSTTNHSSSTLAPTPTSSGGIATATSTQSTSPLPSPFDSGFSNNITATCTAFMNNMLGNSTFQKCLPFSLLLQNSESFFLAEKSGVQITRVLDATCAANVTTCSKLMSTFASNLTQSSSCGSDLNAQNPLVQQGLLGLLAYKPMYQAACLKDTNTGSYCFANAVTNQSSPSDNYIYYLPLNISLPGGSQPTCNTCLSTTMGFFEAASADRSSALASDYVSAAMQVNVNCGPNFVNTSLAAAVKSSDAVALAGPTSSTAGLLLALLLAVSTLLL